MAHHRGPVGQGYMPKGGVKAAEAKNAAWVARMTAELAEASRSMPPTNPVHGSSDPAVVQVRASAPESAVVAAGHDRFLAGVERWVYAGAGASVGVIFALLFGGR